MDNQEIILPGRYDWYTKIQVIIMLYVPFKRILYIYIWLDIDGLNDKELPHSWAR